MTTELEEQFFKVFGVEKKCQCKNFINYADCFRIPTECKEYSYPEISDRILLKLICKAYCLMFSIQGSSIELLKENILKEFIYWQEDIDKSEIQQLFKEGE